MKEPIVYKVLGLMSGSSLDGLDIVYAQYTWANGAITDWKLIEAETIPFSEQWQVRLINLTTQDALVFAKTHTYFGHYMGELVNSFLKKYQIKELDFIASHGHTIFHNPQQRLSIQIGDGGALAAVTGHRVICDFRTQDVAIDGEGAPLAPLADHYLFGGYDFYLNIGGIANLSAHLPDGKWLAFDACPANQTLNRLAKELDQPYDKGGNLARSGKLVPELLELAGGDVFYTKKYPKSLGNDWVQKQFYTHYMEFEASWEDKLHTATAHTALEIQEALKMVIQNEALSKPTYKILATGGGAFNSFLMELLDLFCKDRIDSTIEWIVPEPKIVGFKEALLMGVLGVLRMQQVPNSWKNVTGAKRDTINGAIYSGKS